MHPITHFKRKSQERKNISWQKKGGLSIQIGTKGVTVHPANIYLFKVNNTNRRKGCEMCSELTKRNHRNDVSDVALVFLLLTLKIFHILFTHISYLSCVSIVDFEQLNVKVCNFIKKETLAQVFL